MAITRVGLTGSMTAYGTFQPKAAGEAPPPAAIGGGGGYHSYPGAVDFYPGGPYRIKFPKYGRRQAGGLRGGRRKG